MSSEAFNPATQSRRTALSWDKESKPRVDDIRQSLKAEGYELTNRLLFLLCLGMGWNSKLNPGTPPRTTDSARLESLNEQDWALFNALAMEATGGYEILASKDDVLDIVESYAAGGLRLLVEKLDATQSLASDLLLEIWPKVEEWREEDPLPDLDS